jgi:hypothetical protein
VATRAKNHAFSYFTEDRHHALACAVAYIEQLIGSRQVVKMQTIRISPESAALRAAAHFEALNRLSYIGPFLGTPLTQSISIVSAPLRQVATLSLGVSMGH